ncbi:MAG TPA: hypothetical protein PKA06_03480 [Gemmatales bacterium]|nr:hypothetical protein [Gemmatales bacterium]
MLPEEEGVLALSGGSRRLPPSNVHRIDVSGGSGNDNITLTAEGYLPPGVSLQANLRGGSGRDNILTALSGQNDGDVRIRMDGQSGDDNLAAILGRSTGPVSVNTGTIDIRVDGGSGRDVINSWIGVDSGDEFAPSAGVVNTGDINIRLDGQSGDDRVSFLSGVGSAFASAIINSGLLNVKVEGGSGNDVVVADIGDEIDNGFGDLFFNFSNVGIFHLLTEGGSGRDEVTNVVWIENSENGTFRGRSYGNSGRDSLYYEFRRSGDNPLNAQATLFADSKDDPVLASAIVQVLKARRVTIIPDIV